MSNTSNPLIDVYFKDNTTYVTPTSFDDVTGGVIDAVWGATDTPTVVDSATFDALVNPAGEARTNYSYASAKNYFAQGGTYFEMVRLGSLEQWRYFVVSQQAIASGAGVLTSTLQPAAASSAFKSLDASTVNCLGVLRYRYLGGMSGELRVSNYPLTMDGIARTAYQLDLYIGGTSVESHVVMFSRTDSIIAGESYFYADVLERNSAYLVADGSFVCNGAGSSTGFPADNPSVSVTWEITPRITTGEGEDAKEAEYSVSDYLKSYANFTDRDSSASTILISTVSPTSADAATILAYLHTLSSKRMDCVALIGFNSDNWATDFSNEAVWLSAFTTWFAPYRDKFTLGIVAEEAYTVNGTTFIMDGTAGWAGRLAGLSTAQQSKNVMPSYKAYGAYSGNLTRSLTFEQVCVLHEQGIGSIYSSVYGNYIFDVRSLYGIQSSYFGKANVARVNTALLANVFDTIEQVIHTDVASNAISQLQLQSSLNGILQDMVVRSELGSLSSVTCGSESGGSILTVALNVYYYKLTESVKITITASENGVLSTDLSL